MDVPLQCYLTKRENRRCHAQFTSVRDAYTDVLARRIVALCREWTNHEPFYVIANFKRKFVDANRDIQGAAYNDHDPAAAALFHAYHGVVRAACHGAAVLTTPELPHVLHIDIHGQAAVPHRNYVGTRNGASGCHDTLYRPDSGLLHFFGPMLRAHVGAEYPVEPASRGEREIRFAGGGTVKLHGRTCAPQARFPPLVTPPQPLVADSSDSEHEEQEGAGAGVGGAPASPPSTPMPVGHLVRDRVLSPRDAEPGQAHAEWDSVVQSVQIEFGSKLRFDSRRLEQTAQATARAMLAHCLPLWGLLEAVASEREWSVSDVRGAHGKCLDAGLPTEMELVCGVLADTEDAFAALKARTSLAALVEAVRCAQSSSTPVGSGTIVNARLRALDKPAFASSTLKALLAKFVARHAHLAPASPGPSVTSSTSEVCAAAPDVPLQPSVTATSPPALAADST